VNRSVFNGRAARARSCRIFRFAGLESGVMKRSYVLASVCGADPVARETVAPWPGSPERNVLEGAVELQAAREGMPLARRVLGLLLKASQALVIVERLRRPIERLVDAVMDQAHPPKRL